MAKPKFTAEQKVEIIEAYINGDVGYSQLQDIYGVHPDTIYGWISRYENYGIAAFSQGAGNKCYTKDFKLQCVRAYLKGEGSLNEIAARYNISCNSVLRDWVRCYNADMELEDYEPKREVYMAEAHRKTTLEERKEIVKYCINHNNDYKGTASKYDVSYSQVYYWVKKYRETGEESLIDKRGHHKCDEELDELERLRRENQRLKKQLEERDMLCELLKKVRELEGM